MDDYLTTEDLARRLRTSPETVRFWRHTGKGPASFKVGRRVLYAASDVSAWLEQERLRTLRGDKIDRYGAA